MGVIEGNVLGETNKGMKKGIKEWAGKGVIEVKSQPWSKGGQEEHLCPRVHPTWRKGVVLGTNQFLAPAWRCKFPGIMHPLCWGEDPSSPRTVLQRKVTDVFVRRKNTQKPGEGCTEVPKGLNETENIFYKKIRSCHPFDHILQKFPFSPLIDLSLYISP